MVCGKKYHKEKHRWLCGIPQRSFLCGKRNALVPVCSKMCFSKTSACLCLCVSMSLCLFFFVFRYRSVFVSLRLYVFVSLCLWFSVSLCLSVFLSLCISASSCLDCKCSQNWDTLFSSTDLHRISSNSIHELDELSDSTPQTVIHTPFDMWQFRKFKIKKESLAPEFPRKKETKRKTNKCSSMDITTPWVLAGKKRLNRANVLLVQCPGHVTNTQLQCI